MRWRQAMTLGKQCRQLSTLLMKAIFRRVLAASPLFASPPPLRLDEEEDDDDNDDDDEDGDDDDEVIVGEVTVGRRLKCAL